MLPMNAILRKSDFRLGVCLTFVFPFKKPQGSPQAFLTSHFCSFLQLVAVLSFELEASREIGFAFVIFPYFVITRVSWLGAKWPLFVDRSGFVGIQLKPFGLLGWGQPIG
jgi:hypothetical protein